MHSQGFLSAAVVGGRGLGPGNRMVTAENFWKEKKGSRAETFDVRGFECCFFEDGSYSAMLKSEAMQLVARDLYLYYVFNMDPQYYSSWGPAKLKQFMTF